VSCLQVTSSSTWIAGSPLHRLFGLPEARRAPHQQVPGGRLPLVILAPEKEPLDDLAQPLLGFVRREEGGAGRPRCGLQDGWGSKERREPGATDYSGLNEADTPASCVGHLG